MYPRLNKANGYYAGKSYGSFETTKTTTKTEDKSITQTIKDKLIPQTVKDTVSGNGEKNSSLKWVIIIAVLAVAGYFLYKHYKH